MLKLLCFLISDSWHEHKWEIIKEIRNDIYNLSGSTKLCQIVTSFIKKCEGCGKLREFIFTQGCETGPVQATIDQKTLRLES